MGTFKNTVIGGLLTNVLMFRFPFLDFPFPGRISWSFDFILASSCQLALSYLHLLDVNRDLDLNNSITNRFVHLHLCTLCSDFLLLLRFLLFPFAPPLSWLPFVDFLFSFRLPSFTSGARQAKIRPLDFLKSPRSPPASKATASRHDRPSCGGSNNHATKQWWNCSLC